MTLEREAYLLSIYEQIKLRYPTEEQAWYAFWLTEMTGKHRMSIARARDLWENIRASEYGRKR